VSVLFTMLVAAVLAPEVPPPPDPLELALEWRAPASCPSDAELEARITALLLGPPEGEGVLEVTAEVTERVGEFTLTLRSRLGDAADEKRLAAPTCDELAEATAVLLAIALAPGAALPSSPRTPTAPPRRPEPVPEIDALPVAAASFDEPPPVTSSPVVARRRVRRPMGLALRLAGGLEVGAIPRPAGAVVLGVGLLWRRARLELTGLWLAPRRRGGVRYQLGAVGVRGCARIFVRAVELPMCLGGEVGGVEARPIEASAVGRAIRGPLFAPLASFGVARAWGRVALWTSVEVAPRTIWTRFHRDQDVAFAPLPVSARAIAGIELRWRWNPGAAGH
jgi:hypothetical protein